jgi:hypothetical protein
MIRPETRRLDVDEALAQLILATAYQAQMTHANGVDPGDVSRAWDLDDAYAGLEKAYVALVGGTEARRWSAHCLQEAARAVFGD